MQALAGGVSISLRRSVKVLALHQTLRRTQESLRCKVVLAVGDTTLLVLVGSTHQLPGLIPLPKLGTKVDLEPKKVSSYFPRLSNDIVTSRPVPFMMVDSEARLIECTGSPLEAERYEFC